MHLADGGPWHAGAGRDGKRGRLRSPPAQPALRTRVDRTGPVAGIGADHPAGPPGLHVVRHPGRPEPLRRLQDDRLPHRPARSGLAPRQLHQCLLRGCRRAPLVRHQGRPGALRCGRRQVRALCAGRCRQLARRQPQRQRDRRRRPRHALAGHERRPETLRSGQRRLHHDPPSGPRRRPGRRHRQRAGVRRPGRAVGGYRARAGAAGAGREAPRAFRAARRRPAPRTHQRALDGAARRPLGRHRRRTRSLGRR